MTRHRGPAALVALGLLVAGCTSTVAGRAAPAADLPSVPRSPGGAGTPTPTEDPNAPQTLTIELVQGDGAAGLAALATAYHAAHPNVAVRVITPPADYQAYWAKVRVTLQLSPAPVDVYSVGQDDIGSLPTMPGGWLDLGPLGATAIKGDYFPAAWTAASAPDGTVYGLPREFDPLTLCYRRDLLAAAGLPTDRGALAALWTSWDAYLASGRQFATHGGTARWVDSPADLFRAIVSAAHPLYYDDQGRPVYSANPQVQSAWQRTLQAVAGHLPLAAGPFTPDWFTALRAGKIATVPCAPWMLNLLKAQSGPGAGQWDVTSAPTTGQWGSSYLAVPATSAHPKAAYAFAAWVAGADQQAAAFGRTGAFPANQRGAAAPPVANAVNPAFHNAPVGRLFSDAAGKVPAVRVGPKTDAITDAFGQALLDVATGRAQPAAAWAAALAHIRTLTPR